MKITYYLEVISSWCFWAEPLWAELKRRYGGRVEFEWKIALMRPEDFPMSRAQCDWFYQRSGLMMESSFKLNSGWLEPERKGQYLMPNYVAEAGRLLGVSDDRLRLALSHAAVREGQHVGDLDVSIGVASHATGLSASKLRECALSDEVAQRVAVSTAEFHALQLTQRPAFVLEDAIGDRAVFSGIAKIAPVALTIEAMLADTAAYARHGVHFGKPPE